MKVSLISGLLLCSASVMAQRIDFNISNQSKTTTEENFQPWEVGRVESDIQTFTADDGSAVTIKVEAVTATGYAGNAVYCNWWKDGAKTKNQLLGDAIYPIILEDGNFSASTASPMGLRFTISGLAEGVHSLCAYHNNTDGKTAPGYPKVKVLVDGVTVAEGVEQTIRQESNSLSGMSYIQFNAVKDRDVVVEYVSTPKAGTEYINNYVAVNALIFDRPNPKTTASDPYPANTDMHACAVDAPDDEAGDIVLTWKPASTAVKHHVMLGTSPDNLSEMAATTATSYATQGLTNHNIYYWRIDEEDAAGNRYEGDTWSFRPRHLAFPGAEGYGRFAIGGRGGAVYHVTSLDDDVDNPQPGTFRYGIRNLTGPRTIVFDVSGYITLKGRLTCSDKYVTIAGQTAPGEGITFRGAPLGVNSDGITRFIRSYRGYAGDTSGPIESEQNKGLDGLGLAGGDHAIVDHCSVSWTTDEAFSSRGAKSITLQRTMLSESLNCADHPNYGSGARHGYAATIGGGQGSGVGSFHHNLLAHNEGRNWSISGGLTGGGEYDGAHDVFNNVVYNWGGRATDGGTHEMNFVNNYYKKGSATSQNYLLRLQLEGTGKGTQSAYVSGNIREELNGSKTSDALGKTYRYELSGGQTLDWEPFVSSPFFPSFAKVESAEQAYRNVLSDVGCNLPFFNAHDARMVHETLTGTTSKKGSKTGKKGLIDREWDSEGYVDIPETRRPDDYDTDQDGMPDWWERVNGLSVTSPDNNSDNDNDGYTALEEYLNWMAQPHYEAVGGQSLDIPLSPLFAGYSSAAMFTVTGAGASVHGNVLIVTAPSEEAVMNFEVKCEEGEYSFTRTVNVRVLGTSTGISDIALDGGVPAEGKSAAYNLNGQRVTSSARGIIITNGRKTVK